MIAPIQHTVDRALASALKTLKGVEGIRLQIETTLLKERLTYIWLLPLQRYAAHRQLRHVPPVKPFPKQAHIETDVDKFWSRHTVGSSSTITSERKSLDYIDFFRTQAPLKHELCDLYGRHRGKVILDYGCGPGNDLVGFALHSEASRIIGADVSRLALEMARSRIALHKTDWSRLEFQQLSDQTPEIPIEDQAIDYVHSLGVIHHVSHPMETLREFHRILRPGGSARIMAYNSDSVYVNLNVAYELQVLAGEFPGLTAEEAFETMADLGAPIALCRSPKYWMSLAEEAGFRATYLGAYFSRAEIEVWERLANQAFNDCLLADRHRTFLKSLTIDPDGYPTLNGLTAGMSAVFFLEKI